MKISVVLTTARYGGMDVLFHCLNDQTMPKDDWELIIVDELYDKRHPTLRPMFSARHIPPWKRVDMYDNSTGFNSALAAAKGELIVFAIDYMWVPMDYLQRHWDFYKSHDGWTLTGYMDRYNFPQMRDPLSSAGPSPLWSMFENEFTTEFAAKFFTTRQPVYRERKGGVGMPASAGMDPVVECPGEKIYLIPDSIPLNVLKELNGLDELYNGGYGVNDIDLGWRANQLGHRFAIDPANIAVKLGTPELSAKIPGVNKPKTRTWGENFQLFRQRQAKIMEGSETLAVPEGRGMR